jgi:hypothetical protein
MLWLKPKAGDTRIVWKFALLPTTMSDRTTVVWLERYMITQTYEDYDGIAEWVATRFDRDPMPD